MFNVKENNVQTDADVSAYQLPTGKDLVAIVCAYTDQRWDDIVAVVASLEQQTHTIGQIVLVVDHNDVLLARAQSAFGDRITIVTNSERQGLSGARNSGIAASTAPILAFIDDDAVADRAWAEHLLAAYRDEHVIGVGGTITPMWLDGRPHWWPEEFDWVVGCTYRGHTKTESEIRNAIGANMSIRRTAYERVGGFHEGLGRVGTHPVGAEETELYIRARKAMPNGRVMFAPKSCVDHKVPASRGTLHYFLRRCYAEGLSKAVVAKIATSNGSLSSEWAYTLHTLPAGIVRNIVEAIRHRQSQVAARAGAIFLGLLVTTAGYIRGRLSHVTLRDPSLAEGDTPT